MCSFYFCKTIQLKDTKKQILKAEVISCNGQEEKHFRVHSLQKQVGSEKHKQKILKKKGSCPNL